MNNLKDAIENAKFNTANFNNGRIAKDVTYKNLRIVADERDIKRGKRIFAISYYITFDGENFYRTSKKNAMENLK